MTVSDNDTVTKYDIMNLCLQCTTFKINKNISACELWQKFTFKKIIDIKIADQTFFNF